MIMFCPNCGREIPEGTVCPCTVSVQPPALSSNPALNIIKTIGSSKVFLSAAIIYSASVLISIVLQIFGDTTYDVITYYTGMNLSAVANNNLGTVGIGAVMAAMPSILISVGLWLHYATCRSYASGNISTAGLTICKALTIFTLVAQSVSAVIVTVVLIIVALSSETIAYYLLNAFWYMFDAVYSFSDFAAGLSVVAILLIVICTAAFALGILYNVALLRTINRVKKTALTGVPDHRLSMYVVVWNYIGAVFSGIGGIAMIFINALLGLNLLCTAAFLVLVSICLCNYRSQMTALMYPQVQQMYTQPVNPAYVQSSADDSNEQ